MRRLLLFASGVISFLFVQSQYIQKIESTTGHLIKVTPALRDLQDMSAPPPTNFRKLMSEKNTEVEEVAKYYPNQQRTGPDPVLQGKNTNAPTIENGVNGVNESTVIKSFDGMNAAGVSPTDPCMAVGPNHILQMVNGNVGSQIGGFLRVYDRNGNPLSGQIFMQTLSGLPGYGDCVPIYDRIANRWVITEMPNPNLTTPYKIVILVSKTSDPTGQWYVYGFSVTNQFPDYPKYSLWSNAYYGSGNNYTNGTTYNGGALWALERTKMLAGDTTAKLVNVSIADPDNKFFTIAPVTYQAATPPAATEPGIFMYINAYELTASTTDVDSIGIITFMPDFNNPAASVITRSAVSVATFTANVCSATRGRCIAQPSTTVALEALHWKLMHHLVWRDFGTYKGIVASQTVNAASNIAGIRWYEFRNPGTGWSVYQQGTFAPDQSHRWMPSIAYNGKGEIAVAYMISDGNNVFPGIRVAGRTSSDPLGKLITYDETSVYDGVASQTQNNRAGDYNDLIVDPVDDTTFWYTSQYYGLPSLFGGYTKIIRFALTPPKNLDAKMLSIVSPVDNSAACASSFSPVVNFKNAGLVTLTTLQFNVVIDNGSPATYTWNGNLPLGSQAQVTLPSISATGGTHTLTVYTNNPNGSADENTLNDTARIKFTVLSPIKPPLLEGFESTSFPPPSWRVINPNAGTITWTRTTLAQKSGVASAYINFYNYATTGHLDYLVTPIFDVTNADSIFVSFDRAYVRYTTGTSFSDTLLIQVSTDCGNTFPITVWKKGGNDLATKPGTFTGNWFAGANDWGNERIDIRPLIGNASSITIAFVGKNGYGQNLFLDNINISAVTLVRRDASLRRVIEPSPRLCARTTTPSVELISFGKDTLRSVRIVYTVSGQGFSLTDSVAWTGSLASGQLTSVTLNPVTLPGPGQYSIKAYTKLPNGSNDQNTLNDSISLSFKVFDAQPGPIRESFEQTTFPPANWDVAPSDPNYTWQRNTFGASRGVASAWIRSYRYNSKGAVDDLYSPLIQVQGVDSTFLTFDRAHVTSRYPGSTGVPLDTLEVLITTDCGKTFTSIYKKWGQELQSVNDPNFPGVYPATDTIGFRPNGPNQWKSDSINLSSIVGSSNKFQVVFRVTSNKGNNIYIDNVNIYSVTLPAKLKQNGYLIAPNPFNASFTIRHYLRPVNLRGIQVTNAAGQKVFEMSFNREASSNIVIDLSRYASGVYMVKLIYNDKVITERIVKRQ